MDMVPGKPGEAAGITAGRGSEGLGETDLRSEWVTDPKEERRL